MCWGVCNGDVESEFGDAVCIKHCIGYWCESSVKYETFWNSSKKLCSQAICSGALVLAVVLGRRANLVAEAHLTFHEFLVQIFNEIPNISGF